MLQISSNIFRHNDGKHLGFYIAGPKKTNLCVDFWRRSLKFAALRTGLLRASQNYDSCLGGLPEEQHSFMTYGGSKCWEFIGQKGHPPLRHEPYHNVRPTKIVGFQPQSAGRSLPRGPYILGPIMLMRELLLSGKCQSE